MVGENSEDDSDDELDSMLGCGDDVDQLDGVSFRPGEPEGEWVDAAGWGLRGEEVSLDLSVILGFSGLGKGCPSKETRYSQR